MDALDAADWPLPPGDPPDETGDCSICLCENLQTQRAAGQIGRPNCCGHTFCWDCLGAQAAVATSCPLCRRTMTHVLRYAGDTLCEVVPVAFTELEVDLTANDAEVAQGLAEGVEGVQVADVRVVSTPPCRCEHASEGANERASAHFLTVCVARVERQGGSGTSYVCAGHQTKPCEHSGDIMRYNRYIYVRNQIIAPSCLLPDGSPDKCGLWACMRDLRVLA